MELSMNAVRAKTTFTTPPGVLPCDLPFTLPVAVLALAAVATRGVRVRR
jgi:hypothetical protein